MENTRKLTISKNDWNGIYVPKHTAKLIKSGIENDNAPFLPKVQDFNLLEKGINFVATFSPQMIFNANTGYALDAKDLIPVQFEKAARGYESNVVGTWNTINSAKTAINPALSEDERKGVWYNFKGKDGELHHAAYFFAEQTQHPERFLEFAQKKFKQPQHLGNETIHITSPDVSDYLGAYVAACKSGANIEVSLNVADAFKHNIIAICENELKHTQAEKNPHLPKLNDVLFAADKKANELAKRMEKKHGVAQEQKKHERRIDRSEAMSY